MSEQRQDKKMKKKILIITTGGTLASVHGENGLKPQLKGIDIMEAIEGFSANFQVSFMELFSIDSSNMQPENWQCLAKAIFEQRDKVNGIVVIHGTDTMAYTASALSYMLRNLPIPVVLTGSQLSIANPMADAVENCRSAIHMAASGVAGVFIAFNRKIIRGTRASKVRTVSFDAFESINCRYVAKINSNGLEFSDAFLLAEKVAEAKREAQNTPAVCELHTKLCTKVFLLKVFPGMDPKMLDLIAERGYRAVYIEAFGIGCLPMLERGLTDKIRQLEEKGIFVLVGTQCLHDGSNLSIYETGRNILAQGVLEARDMTTEAAITKLMWVCGQTEDKAEVQNYFEQSLAGEVSL